MACENPVELSGCRAIFNRSGNRDQICCLIWRWPFLHHHITRYTTARAKMKAAVLLGCLCASATALDNGVARTPMMGQKLSAGPVLGPRVCLGCAVSSRRSTLTILGGAFCGLSFARRRLEQLV